MNKDKTKPIGVIECVHKGCIKAKLLNFELLTRLYAYPREDVGLKIYVASCYLPISGAKKIKDIFVRFVTENKLHKNIDSVQYFKNAIGLNITVYSVTDTDKEKQKLSLFNALKAIIPFLEIKLVHVYKLPSTSKNIIERVFLEVANLISLDFNKIKSKLERLGTYKIKSPKNVVEFRQNRKSLYEQQDDPANYVMRKKLFEKFQNRERFIDEEEDALRFYQSFLMGKIDILIREKRITVKEIDRTRKAFEVIKKISGGRGKSNLLPIDLNKIPSWILSFSKNEIPPELKEYNIQASDLFEFYVYKLFSELLALDSRLWGQNETRFKEFSDGYFFIPRENIVCLFDTKASKKGYKKNEVLKFANYVKKHKVDLFAIKRSEIRYFVVISSEFHINFKDQASEFFDIAGVKLVFLRTEDLIDFTSKLRTLSEQKNFLETVKWGSLLSKSDPCLTKKIFEEELKRLKEVQELY